MSRRIVASMSPKRPTNAATTASAESTPRASDPGPGGPAPRLAVVPRALKRHRELTGADFRLLILLMERGARADTIAAPQWELADTLQLDRRTVRGCIARLAAAGVLELVRGARVDGSPRRIAYRLTY